DLESALAKLQQEKDDLAVQRDELLGQLGERFMEVTDLRAERDQAQERLSNSASLLPSAPGHKRTRSESESPAQSARVSKAARSTSSLPQASAPGHAPVSTSSIELLSTAAAGQRATSDESSSGASSSTHVFDSDVAGNDSGSPESSRVKNEFGMPPRPLSDAELAALQTTTVPQSEWIPGYRDRHSFRGHDIVPWSAQDIR
ncbi:hypothetical protein L915_21598, partial [Phytophthora nicotianae]